MKKHRYKLITTGILFTTATAIIHFMNHLISTTAIMKDLLKSTASNYYNWRFGKIYYTKQGTGSPVLLIHDLTIYSSAYEWEALVKQLEKNHTVYCIDLEQYLPEGSCSFSSFLQQCFFSFCLFY